MEGGRVSGSLDRMDEQAKSIIDHGEDDLGSATSDAKPDDNA
jgi:hypothetical protein